MQTRFLTRLGLFLLCLATLACGGGSGGVVEVKGKLLKGGAPLPVPANLPPGDSGIHLYFRSPTDKNEQHEAQLNATTGEFTVPGFNGKGIKPGSYTIEVQVGAFGMSSMTPTKTKSAPIPTITRTVEAGKELIIDLDKPNG